MLQPECKRKCGNRKLKEFQTAKCITTLKTKLKVCLAIDNYRIIGIRKVPKLKGLRRSNFKGTKKWKCGGTFGNLMRGGDVGKVALEIGLNPDGSTAMGNRTIRSRGQTSSPNFMANRIIRS